ncbi:sacsin-like [Ctenopharyngodon idella]|uniref:sacsin-like n=1 Tax=Ctenopharyngodon idella TaxID=7959 RepID=UPI00222E9D65|nr:sacsin-like [Ctenopharyngodon idella]XP_051761771.1 sacsin-like [Ctenopharyngodon idella]XP_051761773.1 sacsin-like [Ctenopharyngodon idella]XP_051761774.1 sacsin-like [Ctenopharyngodon idella]XP_051761775.1 sacsin-like [Ctenopharyngodon idella]
MSSASRQKKKKKNKFGATSPPFIDYLKEILRRYPDGGQILKELIQNADDAGASRVVFIHDERHYGTQSLWTEELRQYQGPALYAFNDAAFTEEDWEGIQRVGRSIKQDDPTKVGRFGIGFNSVYHITDLPCVFSSEHLAIFDPQKKMFGDDEEGYRWSLDDEEDRESLLNLRDQFQPFQNVVSQVSSCSWEKVISEEQYFKGTLFRFPLRNEASEISDNLYDSKKVTQLFDSFIADADISLLFLRNVSSITLLHIDTNGFCNNRLKVSVSNQFDTDLSHVKQESFDRKTCFKTASHISHQMKETRSQWLVTTCLLKHGYKPEIDSLASKLSFYPQVDAAFQIDEDRSRCNGRLSCFLPLPNNESNKTGLPIHINACFGLTDNRRFIKWQEEDQKNDESAKWNELLIKDILPHVYLLMILDAIQLSRNSTLPAATVYNLWPDLSKTVHKERWHEVATDTLKGLIEYKIFHLANDEKIWVSPSDAVFPVNNICSDKMSAISRLLIAEGENLVTLPEHVLKDVQEIFPESDTLTSVTPSYVRDVLHRSKVENLSKDDKYSLLEFALSDEKYEELQGLKLLPLSDGICTSFSNGAQNTVLIDNEKFPRTLLPFCKERFLPNDLSHFCIMQLRKLATKSTYNIINLDAKHVVALTKKHLPMDWKVSQGHVTWKTAENHHPPKSWLAEFWKFLSTELIELNSFIDMPLIPLEPLQSSGNSVLLAKLQSNTTLIFQRSTASSLSDHVQKVLRMVGCTIIKRDGCLRHHDIERYVLPPSPRSVLQVFVNSHRDQVIKGIASTSSQEKEELKMYLCSLDSLSNAEKNLLSMLPIFRMMSGKYVAVQSKQAVVLTTNPAIPKDLPVPETIVQCANEADRRLLTLLNIELLDAAKVAVRLVDCIETASFKKNEEQTVMTWILNNGSILLSQSEQLLTKTKSLKFIETTHGEHKQASNVFDPRNRTFQDLFEADFFPPPVYTKTQEMLQSLQRLGLKTEQKEITTENILQVINHIEKLCVHSPDKAFKKAHTLVRVLNENNFLSKFNKAQIEKLKQRQWVPCENPKFLNGSICRNLKRGLYKPAEVRDSKYSSIVGYAMPLTSELTGHVCKNLGLYEPPPAEKVLENLSALRSMVNPNSDFQFKTKLHNIYNFMQENMRNFTNLLDKKSIPWVWNKSEFVCPGDIVLAYPPELDLSPYIKKVPEEFLQYENLLTKFGVKKTLSDEEIEDILHDIKQRIDRRYPPHGNLTELKVSIAILDWMRKNEKLLKDSTPVPVMAQNQNFTLQSLSKTVFCDISAEGLDDLKQDNEEFYVIHEEVLPITARWLKVPFLSTRILKPQFIQAEQESFGIEQCGQSERITQRIKNILKEYDEESDIFKELIQNAEDAGATTCKFLLDFRKHKDPPETLFDDGMALCNGPCLWIFNNELFSEEDWRNIVKVGSASKENKVEMIGKFGLGFNAVYHVSDIPSILSGKTLLILDPNVTHLEKHILSKGNPGIKLDPFQERLYKRFPGQFKSYEGIFDCDLSVQNSKKAYNGTLIKLPFRTLEEANKSEISSKVYDDERIRSFKNHLTDNSQTHLLFLKSITSLSLQIVPENASTPPWNDQIQTPLKISREVLNSFPVSNDTLLQEIENTFRNDDIKCHNIIDVNKAHIVKIVQEHSEKSLTQYWLLYSCFGTHDSLQMFQRRNEQEHAFSFPIGSIAVPLHREAKTNAWSPDENLFGQAFCFLPLSIETGLPVHVNGTFAVTSNRKGLWEKGVKSEWNKALLKDAVTSAYITTLLELKKMTQNGHIHKYSFHTFWPNTQTVNKAFLPMVKSFYSAVVQNANGKSLELFSNGQNWCSIDKVRFLNQKIEDNRVIRDIAMKVLLSLGASYSSVVSLPSWVKQSFIDCGFKTEIKQRTINWPEFYNIVFKNLSVVNTHSRNTLVLNAIDLNDPAVDDLLKSYPCIPTQSCKKLQFIKRLVNPSGKVACLYELKEGRFLEGTANDFLSPKRIQRLSDLGMLSDRLPLEDIIERAGKISSVWQQDKSKCHKRLQCLLESMKDSSEDDNSLHWQTLSQIPFLPAVVPLVQQNKKATVLKKPSEVYSNICHNLVSLTGFTVDHSNLQIHNYDPVFKKLRVLTNPPVETVLQQLLKAHQHCNAFEKTALFSIAQSCYEYLNNYLLEQKDPNPIIGHAKSFPFIFIEDHFINVRSVARSEEFEEKPYLYVLPVIFSKFERLWDCLGVYKQFTKEQFVAALNEIKALYGSQPLSMSDLHKCVAILMKGLYKIKDENLTNCLIPDERGVLTSSRELRFNDSPWMPVAAGVKLAHNLIPRPVACHFGVMTTRHHTLKSHLVSGFSLHAKEFGQTEKLTVRIKNIIDAYPSKKDILKELIQNADDAQATEIHFVWDKRQHKTEKIFGKKWELVQGPALCVYNNRTFSDADLEGIQQLGEGGKHGTLGRTGKYGLGFNSVYHLTDCPSILTGDKWLCISDPNLKYVEGVTKQAPGCMFSIDDELKKSFEDVYHTFLPEMFALNSGTMFRLPLRTEEMAEKSEISRHTVTDRDMEDLRYALTEDPEGLILFLKHITKIQFLEISEDGKGKQSSFLIEKKYTEKSMVSKENFHRHVRESLLSGTAEPFTSIYGMQILSGNKQSQWVIAESFGFSKQIDEQKNKQDHFKVPQAALAACWKSSFNQTFTGRAFCSLPLPGQTGLPVHVNANFEVDSSRRDLWKEDGDSLKTEWNQSLKVNIISPLYADLLLRLCSVRKDTPIALVYLKSQLESSCLNYFPCISPGVDKVWHEMIHEVYKSISQRDLPVIPTVHAVSESSHHSLQKYTVTWCSPSKPHSENCPYFTSNENDGIFEVLDDTGMKLVPNSYKIHEIKDNFKSAGVNVTEVSASTVMNFLKQRSLNDPSQTNSDLPLPINQTWIKDKIRCSKLLSFCLTNADEKNIHDLNGLPLLLTQDQMLRVFDSKSPKLISRFSSLFQGHQEMFADSDVNRSHVQILRKGKFIKDLTIDIAATYLKPELAELLSQSLPDQMCQLYKAETSTIKWLKTLWRFFDDQEKSIQNESLNVFSEIKKHFENSPILPVICPSQNNAHFLQTMGNISKVIQYQNENIASILIKLGLMKLDLSFFSDLRPEFRLKYMNPELLQTGDSSAVLGQVYHVPHSQFEELSKEECVDLQCFLQHGIRDSNNKSQHVWMLKSLPLFESITGKRKKIDSHRIFILHSLHYTDFPNLYEVEGCDSIFLKNTWVNLELAEHLNIKVLNDLEFCVQFILPSVHMMNEAKLLDLMRFLVELGPVDPRVVSALRDVRFIRDIHCSLQVASYFYDDSVSLYRVMLPKERFVPETFWEIFRDKRTEAHRLLKDLGLKHEVSDEEIIQFAKQIESETRGKTPIDVLKERSKLLFRIVLSKSIDKNSNLLNRVANIKFIFPIQIQQTLCDYHKAFTQEREVVAISGSLTDRDSDHHYLIWTSMPILPSELCSPHLIKKMKDAGALETPPPEQIAANLKNISTTQCHSDRLLDTREKVFSKSYAYLQSINFDASLFSDLPIILVENGSELVMAKQTALVLNDALEFRPYLYRIPPNYTKFEDFFKKIGVKERPTVNQYITVLQEIYSDSSDKDSLQANQQKAVKRVVQQLFCLLKEEQDKTSFQNDPLYLPSTDGRLYESSTLFFNDTVFQPERLEGPLETKLKLLEKFNCCYLGDDHYEHQTLLQLLPQQVRPKFLSDVISENLEGASVQYCDEGECEFSGWFDKHLSSAAFLHGLVCLIREDSKGVVSQPEAAGKCEEIFSKIQIICCKTLQTELLLNHEPLEGSKAETGVYVKKQKDGCSFYLKHNDDMAHKVVNEVNMCLTKEINALLKNCLTISSLLVLGQLLLCDNMEDVEKTLANHGIHNSGHKEEGHSALPKPGCRIPEEWHDCLDMNFHNNFESGEYVGFSKDESGEYFYAIVINRLDDPLGQIRQFPARYKIQVGSDDFIEVSSLALYQFKREKKATVSTGSTCTDIERLLTSRPPPKTVFPETFEEIKREIDQSLNEIWNMSSEDKQKALKRLYLRWHPDKNPGNEELANEAFKYLQNRIEELQQGKATHSTSSTWRDFRDFYDMWNSEARSHRRGRERFYQNYSRRHYNFWSYHRETPRPNRGEAKRWFEQAQCDIRAAHNDTGGDCSEWCLFKVHQAVEKALIAAMYKRSGQHPNNCSITSLAQQVSHYSSQLTSLPKTVRQLTELGVDGKKTQYPNHHQFPHIPNKQFSVNNARQALDIATKLLEKIEEYIS